MKIIQAITPEELQKYYNVRYEVLRKPLNKPYSATMDDEENISLHYLLLNDEGEAKGTGRLQLNSEEEGQVRSITVWHDEQGKGLGTLMVRYIEKKARERKMKHLVLDARENAIQFYEKLGYKVTGEAYILFGIIKHYRMKKDL